MGLYYNPQPPHIGAAQPLEPRKLVPPSGPTPQNPPFTGSRVRQEVLVSWAAAAAAVVILPQLLVPGPAVASVPPPQSLTSIYDAWDIKASASIVARNLTPLSAPSAVVPPSRFLVEVYDAWDTKPSQALVAKNLTPSSGPTPQNPPIVGAYIPAAVQVSWAPPPWPAQWSPPLIQGVAVPQNPPFVGGARVTTAVLNAWLPPQPQPITSVLLNPPQGFIPPPPPVGAFIPTAVLVSWIPPAPQPIVGQRLTPPSTIASNPPIIGTAIPQAALNWWYQPFTPIIVGVNLTPPISGPTPPPVITVQGGGGKKKKRGPSVRPIWDYANDGRLIRQTVSTDHSKPVEARRVVDTTMSELAREIELERTKLEIAALKTVPAAKVETKSAPIEQVEAGGGEDDDEHALALLNEAEAKEGEAVKALLQEISDLGLSDDEHSEIVAKIEGTIAEMRGSFSKFSDSVEGMFHSILETIERIK